MNHLAHFWLAHEDPLHRLGVALGDFWRGAVPPDWPEAMREGLHWHRRVDRLTDHHPSMVAMRGTFEPPYRRYAGILLDIWCDHALVRHFGDWTGLDLDRFAPEFVAELETTMATLDGRIDWPEHFPEFVGWLRRSNALVGYGDPSRMARTLRGIGQRFRRPVALEDAWPLLAGQAPALDELARTVLLALHEVKPQLGADSVSLRRIHGNPPTSDPGHAI